LRAGKDTDARVKLLTSKLDKRLHDVITVAVTPPEDFAKRVSELTTLSKEETLKDKFEEQLPASPVPTTQIKK
jgi:predicted RNA-binding protein with EMAP domain